MKAVLEFTLPEEREDHELALKGAHYKSVIDQVFGWIRKKEKYDDTMIEVQFELLSELRDFVAEELNNE